MKLTLRISLGIINLVAFFVLIVVRKFFLKEEIKIYIIYFFI